MPGRSLLMKASGATGDPFRSFRTLILHGNGINGSTNFVDSSPSPASITATGSAAISTAQSRFGGASISFIQTPIGSLSFTESARLSFPGDFNVETWVFFPSAPSVYAAIFEARTGNKAEPYALGFRNVSGSIVPELYTGALTFQATAGIAVNTWNHVAWVRSGSTMTTYVNKIPAGTVTLSGNLAPSNSTITIGRLPADNINATFFIDELIVTKGIALTPAQFAFDAPVLDF